MPSQRKKPRTHWTRRDPLEAVWAAVVEQLEREPRLSAKALLEWLERESCRVSYEATKHPFSGDF